jgi:sugar phosphate isomerase/epimerase
MKISITPISIFNMIREQQMGLQGFINYCAELEVDGVDILDSNCYPWLWKNKGTEIKKLNSWVEAAGVKIAAFATGNNFALFDEEKYKQNVKNVKLAINETAEVGATILRIFGGSHQDSGGEPGMNSAVGLEKVVRGIEACLPYAEKNKVIMALENHGRLPGYSYEIKSLIDFFDSPYLKCTFDCANFMGNNMDEPECPLSAYERLKENIVHVHIKDFGPSITNTRKLHGYVVGKGNVPLRQFAALLDENSYSGFCALEYEGSIITPEEYGVPQSINFLKKIKNTQEYIRQLASGRE